VTSQTILLFSSISLKSNKVAKLGSDLEFIPESNILINSFRLFIFNIGAVKENSFPF